MSMLELPGPLAETAFRLRRLTREITARCSEVRAVNVRFVHFVHVERELTDSEREILDALLTYGGPAKFEQTERGIVIVPRLGTISPWASKATDIARNCGLPVHRVERGRRYSFDVEGGLSEARLERRCSPSIRHDPCGKYPCLRTGRVRSRTRMRRSVWQCRWMRSIT
jgi:phosphoribosylformylglycinamidine synthase